MHPLFGLQTLRSVCIPRECPLSHVRGVKELKFFTCVVGFDGFGLNYDTGVTSLDVLRLVGNRPRDVATCQETN